jgi:hypothetical protein
MNKLQRDLRVALGGACCGLFSSSLFLLAARIDRYYAYVRWNRANDYIGGYYGVDNLWWVPVVAWHVVLTIVASFLMHRYLASDRVSSFLRWQAIGLAALSGWAFTIIIGFGLECLARGNTISIEHLSNSFNYVVIGQFVATVFAANVLYGSAIQAASSEDITHSSTAGNAT